MLGICHACMQYQTVNSRSKSNGIIIKGWFGSIREAKLQASLSSAYKLLLLNHQAHTLDNPALRYIVFCSKSVQIYMVFNNR